MVTFPEASELELKSSYFFLFEIILVEWGQSLNNIYFIILCVFVCMSVCVCEYTDIFIPCTDVKVRGQYVGVGLSFHHVAPRIKLRSSGVAVRAFTH